MKTDSHILGLVAAIALCFGAAAIGGFFTTPSIPTWYATLQKPSWTPPSWVFGPVWTVLYLMMAIALWFVWRKVGLREAAIPTVFFLIQLTLNVLWSILFFGLHRPAFALADIIALWLAILITLILFWRVTLPAGLLLIPYLLWVTYASTLNWGIVRLNH
jgi:translocator protein